MADMNSISAVYYRDLLEKDPLLPQSGELPEARMFRVWDEHKFLMENSNGGREQCNCHVCASFRLLKKGVCDE